MLQQTRVATVIARYSEFLRRFPTIAALAAAPEDDVLALWSGLGYYRRARMLHRGAQFVARELGGTLPETATELRTLPGVGEYTAAAIASIAFGQSIAVLDGNVERVLLRLLGRPEGGIEDRAAAVRTALLATANELVPPARARRGKNHGKGHGPNPPGDHNQAMMELGATICLPRGPLCLQCPVFAFCRTRGEHPTGKRSALRSRHVACLLTTRKRGTRTEVLLERRPAEATLMPGMLELPPLPLEAVAGREPALRLRHSITNTNYYVEVYAEGAAGAPAELSLDASLDVNSDAKLDSGMDARLASGLDRGLAPESDGMAASPGVLPFPAPSTRDANGDSGVDVTGSATGEAGLGSRRSQAAAVFGTVFRGEPGMLGANPSRQSLQNEIPAAAADLVWCATHRLYEQPLTGLARKALQRMGLMPMQAVRVRSGGSV